MQAQDFPDVPQSIILPPELNGDAEPQFSDRPVADEPKPELSNRARSTVYVSMNLYPIWMLGVGVLLFVMLIFSKDSETKTILASAGTGAVSSSATAYKSRTKDNS